MTAEVTEGAAHVVRSFARGLILSVTRLFRAHFVAVETGTQGALLPARVGLHSARYGHAQGQPMLTTSATVSQVLACLEVVRPEPMGQIVGS